MIAAHGKDPSDETAEAIVMACKQALPNFMVPARILWQDALPRNPNSKIDRKKLAAEFSDIFQNDN